MMPDGSTGPKAHHHLTLVLFRPLFQSIERENEPFGANTHYSTSSVVILVLQTSSLM